MTEEIKRYIDTTIDRMNNCIMMSEEMIYSDDYTIRDYEDNLLRYSTIMDTIDGLLDVFDLMLVENEDGTYRVAQIKS